MELTKEEKTDLEEAWAEFDKGFTVLKPRMPDGAPLFAALYLRARILIVNHGCLTFS
jgi:hypothetical protein